MEAHRAHCRVGVEPRNLFRDEADAVGAGDEVGHGQEVLGGGDGGEMFVMLDDQGHELGARPHIGPPNGGLRPHTAVNRRTLRQILAVGLDDALHFDHTATGYELAEDEVRLHFANGSSTTGDVLVAADGINLVIRQQLLPDVATIDDGCATCRGERRSPTN